MRARRLRYCALGVGLLGAVAATVLVSQRQLLVCADGDERMAEVWSPEIQQQLHDAFTASGLAFAEDTWSRVEGELDRHAARWVEGYEQACKATRVHETQSEQTLDLRMACLERSMVGLGSLLDAFSRDLDRDTVEAAVEAVAGLEPVRRCANTETLLARVPLPDDPEVEAAVRDVRSRISRARGESLAGRYAIASEQFEGLVEESRLLDYEPLLAEALLAYSSALSGEHRFEEAAAALEQAYHAAIASGDDEHGREAAISLVFVVGYRMHQPRAVESWIEVSRAWVRRAPKSDVAEAELLTNLASTYTVEGRWEDVERLSNEAVEVLERLDPPDPHTEARAVEMMGMATANQGRYDEALEHFDRVLAIRRREYGDGHPQVGNALLNRSNVDYVLGRHQESIDDLERAVEIYVGAYGPDYPDLAGVYNNMGINQRSADDHEGAQRSYRRAIEILEHSSDDNPPMLVDVLINLGDSLRQTEQAEPAREAYARAVALGQQAELPEGHPRLPLARSGLGKALTVLGDHDRARAQLELAVEGLELAQGGHPVQMADTRFALAEVLWAFPSERSRARTLADEAMKAYREAPEAWRAKAETVEQWLQDHPDDGATASEDGPAE